MNAESLMSILRGACILQCLSIGFILIIKKHKSHSGNLFLGFYLLVGAINFTLPLIQNELGEWTMFLNNLTASVYGPLLYLFFSSYLGEHKRFTPSVKQLIIIPLGYVILYSSTDYYLQSKGSYHLLELSYQIDVFNTLLLLYCLFLFSVRGDNFHNYRVSMLFKYRWLKFLIGFSVFLNASYYLVVILSTYNRDLALITAEIHFIFILLFINTLIYVAVSFPELVSDAGKIKSRLSELDELKYTYSDLTKDEAQMILLRLEDILKEEKLYKNPSITLETVAHKIGKEPKNVSQSINQYLKKNFKEYLNEIKIQEAAKLLSDPNQASLRINEVMYEVGFNSKSSFNTLFKKLKGLTPKEYRLKSQNVHLP